MVTGDGGPVCFWFCPRNVETSGCSVNGYVCNGFWCAWWCGGVNCFGGDVWGGCVSVFSLDGEIVFVSTTDCFFIKNNVCVGGGCVCYRCTIFVNFYQVGEFWGVTCFGGGIPGYFNFCRVGEGCYRVCGNTRFTVR